MAADLCVSKAGVWRFRCIDKKGPKDHRFARKEGLAIILPWPDGKKRRLRVLGFRLKKTWLDGEINEPTNAHWNGDGQLLSSGHMKLVYNIDDESFVGKVVDDLRLEPKKGNFPPLMTGEFTQIPKGKKWHLEGSASYEQLRSAEQISSFLEEIGVSPARFSLPKLLGHEPLNPTAELICRYIVKNEPIPEDQDFMMIDLVSGIHFYCTADNLHQELAKRFRIPGLALLYRTDLSQLREIAN